MRKMGYSRDVPVSLKPLGDGKMAKTRRASPAAAASWTGSKGMIFEPGLLEQVVFLQASGDRVGVGWVGVRPKAVGKALTMSWDENSQVFIKRRQDTWSPGNTSHFKCPLF